MTTHAIEPGDYVVAALAIWTIGGIIFAAGAIVFLATGITRLTHTIRTGRRTWDTLDRVRALRDDLHGITGARWIANALDNILDEQPTPDTAPTEPADTCRPIDVDGQTIHVRGTGEMTEQDRAALADIIRAAKRKYAAEHPALDEPKEHSQEHGIADD